MTRQTYVRVCRIGGVWCVVRGFGRSARAVACAVDRAGSVAAACSMGVTLR